MKEYDCFRKQKDSAFIGSLSSMYSVIQYADEFYKKYEAADASTLEQLEEFFYKLLRVSCNDPCKNTMTVAVNVDEFSHFRRLI